MIALLLTAALAVDPAPTAPAEPVVEEPAADEASGPVTYDLQSDSGRLYVLVRYKRGTLGSGLAHDHVVVASGWSGEVTWDADNLAACRVSIDVPVSGLVVDPGSARSWEGLEGSTPDDDKETIRSNFRGDRQLDMENHPQIRFRSTACSPADGDRVNVSGDLTIHGMSHRVTVPMNIRLNDGRFGATGRFDANHGDFGMRPFSAAFGAVKNDERLSFVVDVTGAPR